MDQMNKRISEILLVEDSPADVRLIKETFKDGKVQCKISVASDGIEAMAFLQKEGEFKDSPTPDLILLDLNLPRRNGFEVLIEIRKNQILKHIPVIVLTTSNLDQDIIKAYDLHASCYIAKPNNLDDFMKMVRSIETFWLSTVDLPVE